LTTTTAAQKGSQDGDEIGTVEERANVPFFCYNDIVRRRKHNLEVIFVRKKTNDEWERFVEKSN